MSNISAMLRTVFDKYQNHIFILANFFSILVIGNLFINPLWKALALDGMFFDANLPPITAPIDGIYYIENAINGFAWDNPNPLSFWFHPLPSLMLRLLPNFVPANKLFYFLSQLFTLGNLYLTVYSIKNILYIDDLKSFFPIFLFIPGGISFITGNAETMVLFFSTLFLISILKNKSNFLTITTGALAILTKPNALYLVPMLFFLVYEGAINNKQIQKKKAIIGIITLIITWLLWIIMIDIVTRDLNVYWNIRKQEAIYQGTGSIVIFFQNLARAFKKPVNLRDLIRYFSALIIPIMNFVIIGVVEIEKRLRFLVATANMGMFFISMYLGNPNKILVYSTTIPLMLPIYFLFLKKTKGYLHKDKWKNKLKYIFSSFYIVFCLILFIIGTPLRWYH